MMQKTAKTLLRKLHRKQQSEGGFTLVELIVVLVIMGLLSAALVPTVTGYVEEAKTKIAKSNEAMVEQAALLYLADLERKGATIPQTAISEGDLTEAGYLSGDPKGKSYEITFTRDETSGRYTVAVTESAQSS